jgi:hypothetical protein
MAKTYDMDGSMSNSISDRQEKKKKNLLLDPIKKRLLNKKNKAPASTFTKRQQRLKDLLDKQ